MLPVRKPRSKVRERWFTYHVYVSYQQSTVSDQPSDVFTLIRRRENPKDIWYHLYEFPCEETQSERLKVNGERIIDLTHVLSHQKIHARFIIHKVQQMPEFPGTMVIRWDELNDYALSRLTLRALDTLRLTPRN